MLKKFSTLTISFLQAAGTVIYISGVAWLMMNGEKIFGQPANFLGPITFLLLFVISATIVSLLILGYPLTLYFNGEKKKGWQTLAATIGWMVLMLMVTLTLQLIK